MTRLAEEHCTTGGPGTNPALEEADAVSLMAEIPSWRRDDLKLLVREFTFDNFREAFTFVSKVAALAESENHHPDVEFGWGRAKVSLTTHSAGGLTRNDFVMAAKIDLI